MTAGKQERTPGPLDALASPKPFTPAEFHARIQRAALPFAEPEPEHEFKCELCGTRLVSEDDQCGLCEPEKVQERPIMRNSLSSSITAEEIARCLIQIGPKDV